MSYCYIIVANDNASENYTYGILESDKLPVVFTSYEKAKTALKEAAAEYDTFSPVAYGSAFPYDNVTFDDELEKKSFAPLGWGIIEIDDEVTRVCLGLLRLPVR